MKFSVLAVYGALIPLSSLAVAQEGQLTLQTLPAVVVKTIPEAGDTSVDPNLGEIRVTFSKKMQDKRWSWGQMSDETYPKTTGKPHYLPDNKTCVLPVKLEPGRTYILQINALSGKFHNFTDQDQRPSVAYLLAFQTRGGQDVGTVDNPTATK
jgi:Bacterial Ig-like domain